MAGSKFDDIGATYDLSKMTPSDRYLEQPTFLRELGDLSGRSVLDLACGTGYYTRLIRHGGASRVVGIDVSPKMIEVAQEQESSSPMGIVYQAADVTALPKIADFDIVSAAWLLNHAADEQMLTKMAEAIARNLVPGGRLVGTTINPEFDYHGPNSTPYGYTVTHVSSLPDGNKYGLRIHTDPPVYFEAFQLSKETYERVLAAAGLTGITWTTPEVPAEGLREYGDSFWDAWQRNPSFLVFTATRTDRSPDTGTDFHTASSNPN